MKIDGEFLRRRAVAVLATWSSEMAVGRPKLKLEDVVSSYSSQGYTATFPFLLHEGNACGQGDRIGGSQGLYSHTNITAIDAWWHGRSAQQAFRKCYHRSTLNHFVAWLAVSWHRIPFIRAPVCHTHACMLERKLWTMLSLGYRNCTRRYPLAGHLATPLF